MAISIVEDGGRYIAVIQWVVNTRHRYFVLGCAAATSRGLARFGYFRCNGGNWFKNVSSAS
jgi:hypothetical protein